MASLIDQWLRGVVLDGGFGEALPVAEDWDRFCEEAARHGLAGLFYSFVKDTHAVPSRALAVLRRWHENSLVYRDYCIQRLRRLQPLLCRNGRVVLTQGLALCEHLYVEPLSRHMSDVDLLLPDGTLREVGSILAAEGFRRWGGYRNLWHDGTMHLDLHTDLWGASRVPGRGLVVGKQELSAQPSCLVPGFHVLSAGQAALQAVYHGVKHAFCRRIWLCDAALLVGKGLLDREAAGGAAMLVATVIDHLRMRGLAGERVPARRLGALRRFLFGSAVSLGERPGAGELALAVCCPGWRQTGAYLMSTLLPERSALRDMYGDRPYPFLLLRRVVALVRRATQDVPWREKV